MKKKKLAGLLLISAIVLSGCSDNDYAEYDKGSDVLTLTTDQTDVTLAEIFHASDALTLSWTTGTNHGTGNRINYTLELAPSGSAFANAYTAVNQETQVYSWTISQENLNNLLRDRFGIAEGQTAVIDARVTAHVLGLDEVQTSLVQFSATPYLPVTSTLYLIGDATPNGWSADNATEMTRTDAGVFSWEGKLTQGSFKFITTRGEFIPSYNKDANGNATLRSSYDEPDDQWTISEEGFYKVQVNLLTGTLTLKATEGNVPAFDNLYFVGHMTGWEFVKMNRDPLDPYLFRYGRYFGHEEGGEFKFGTAAGSWENMYKATQPNAPYTDTATELITGYEPDNKWYLQDNELGKAYKICIDIRTGKEKMMMSEFIPYEMIYLVGDAVASGWDISNATAMSATDSPYIFTWTGSLSSGELKFTCDKKDDWNGAWFLNASGNDIAPTGETERMLFIDKSSNDFRNQYPDINIGEIDQKWMISAAGTYQITLNQLEETVSIVKK